MASDTHEQPDLYFWRGRKSHKHYKVTLGTTGKERGKPIEIKEIEIAPGETFRPSHAELKAFRDLLEPYGESLKVTEPQLTIAEAE